MLGTEVTVTFVPITFEKALKLNASKPFGWTMITDKPSTVSACVCVVQVNLLCMHFCRWV